MNVFGSPLVWTHNMIAIGAARDRGGRVLAVEREAESAGDAWFRAFGDRELNRAYHLAGFILGDAAEAEDATQDALTRAWNRRSTLQSAGSAQAWFDRILVNACRDRLRRRRASVRWVPIEDDVASAPDPFAEAIAADSLLRALATLDLDHRVVVVLRLWADLPLAAVAERLQIPVGTVKSRLHYALRELRVVLERGEQLR